jgi:hypothetical protein
MARADWRARVIFLPKALKHNPPQSPSVVMGWRQAWAEVPACGLKKDAAGHVYQMLAAHGDAYAKAFAAFALDQLQDQVVGEADGRPPHTQPVTQPDTQPMEQPADQAGSHQDQEQEQEQEQEEPRARARTGADNRGGVNGDTLPGEAPSIQAAKVGRIAETAAVHKLIAGYADRFETVHGTKPQIVGGRDGGIFKALTSQHSAEVILAALDRFFADPDPFVANSGHTLTLFRSQFNRFLVASRRPAGILSMSPKTAGNAAAAERFIARGKA